MNTSVKAFHTEAIAVMNSFRNGRNIHYNQCSSPVFETQSACVVADIKSDCIDLLLDLLKCLCCSSLPLSCKLSTLMISESQTPTRNDPLCCSATIKIYVEKKQVPQE